MEYQEKIVRRLKHNGIVYELVQCNSDEFGTEYIWQREDSEHVPVPVERRVRDAVASLKEHLNTGASESPRRSSSPESNGQVEKGR